MPGERHGFEGAVDLFSLFEAYRDAVPNEPVLKKPKSTNNYIICATERSGSTTLCSLLAQTGVLGQPDEYLNARGVVDFYLKQYPSTNISEYVDQLRRDKVSPNGVFGLKTAYVDFEPLVDKALCAELLAPLRFIYLYRTDLLLQAISGALARETGFWHARNEHDSLEASAREVEFSEPAILETLELIIRERQLWERFFALHSVDPLRISYEQMVADTATVIDRVGEYLGVVVERKMHLNMSATQKLGDERNLEWAKRLRATYSLGVGTSQVQGKQERQETPVTPSMKEENRKRPKAQRAEILRDLYLPSRDRRGEPFYFLDMDNYVSITGNDQKLPLAPLEIRMGYGQTDEEHLESGRTTASSIRSILADHGIELGEDSVVMDWGCAGGRVLRHFAEEAEQTEFWGLDRDEQAIRWAKENLSPPFHFLTVTTYPHLPFPDEKFSLVYGISVFTHIEHLVDLWLMEFNRVLQRGGHAIFTIHDENTAEWLYEHNREAWPWVPPELDLLEVPYHDVTNINIPSGTYAGTYTFFKQDWIRREWGRYFQVVEMRPYAEFYQTAVLLRKY